MKQAISHTRYLVWFLFKAKNFVKIAKVDATPVLYSQIIQTLTFVIIFFVLNESLRSGIQQLFNSIQYVSLLCYLISARGSILLKI